MSVYHENKYKTKYENRLMFEYFSSEMLKTIERESHNSSEVEIEGRNISELVSQINLEEQALPIRTRNRIHDFHPGRIQIVRPISSLPLKNTPSRACASRQRRRKFKKAAAAN